MKCPKCGFNSFEFLDNCKKCGHDLASFKESLGIKPIVLASAVPAVSPSASLDGTDLLPPLPAAPAAAANAPATPAPADEDIFSFDFAAPATASEPAPPPAAMPATGGGDDDFAFAAAPTVPEPALPEEAPGDDFSFAAAAPAAASPAVEEPPAVGDFSFDDFSAPATPAASEPAPTQELDLETTNTASAGDLAHLFEEAEQSVGDEPAAESGETSASTFGEVDLSALLEGSSSPAAESAPQGGPVEFAGDDLFAKEEPEQPA